MHHDVEASICHVVHILLLSPYERGTLLKAHMAHGDTCYRSIFQVKSRHPYMWSALSRQRQNSWLVFCVNTLQGMLILSSGAVFKHVEALSLGRPSKYPWAELNQTIRRKLAFVCMYFLAMRYRCRDQVRWWLTLVSLAATFCTEALSIDPLSVCDDFVCKALAR